MDLSSRIEVVFEVSFVLGSGVVSVGAKVSTTWSPSTDAAKKIQKSY